MFNQQRGFIRINITCPQDKRDCVVLMLKFFKYTLKSWRKFSLHKVTGKLQTVFYCIVNILTYPALAVGETQWEL